ncbi:peptidoglycan-binding protein [Hylemonella gracilis str. Niagara R]|uniref:Peptidoglycan-associated lipoprotein n=1 Tax=Hylemonella gracilis str. Niagara R TaxID=1458275 RepID=A0A016XHR9_9BURK|nr:peptidoglycan-associated lipoprotein Pal [Hylemonella gracilis]EYC51629.1 peptidoglycan-binding protein [Hylemonella gracilis str. Niagara R]
MSSKKWILLGVAPILTLVMAGCSSVALTDTPSTTDSAATAAPAAAAPTTTAAPEAAPASAAAPVVATTKQAESIADVAKLIYFDYDSSAIKPEFRAVIEAHARFLQANPTRSVTIAGHADERGGTEYNLALGQRRADALRQMLVLLGVNASQIETISYGKEKPAVRGSNEAAWSKNRRDEIIYK